MLRRLLPYFALSPFVYASAMALSGNPGGWQTRPWDLAKKLVALVSALRRIGPYLAWISGNKWPQRHRDVEWSVQRVSFSGGRCFRWKEEKKTMERGRGVFKYSGLALSAPLWIFLFEFVVLFHPTGPRPQGLRNPIRRKELRD